MDLRFVVVLCALFSAVSAAVEDEEEQNVLLPKFATCLPCKVYEFSYNRTMHIATGQQRIFLDSVSAVCDQLATGLKGRCLKQMAEYKKRVQATTAVFTSQSLCDAVFGCGGIYEMSQESFENPARFGGRLCAACKAAAGAAQTAVDLESSVKLTTEALSQLCHQYPVLDEETCMSYVEGLAGQLRIPTPAAVCTISGFCNEAQL